MVELFFWEDLEKQDANPYETVISAAREARRVNADRRAKGLELLEKPTTIALRRLVGGRTKVSYLSAKEIASLEDSHVQRSGSDDKKDPAGGDRGNRGV